MEYVAISHESRHATEAENVQQGSYPGARAAHMKILYPELVFGAIASSGKVHCAKWCFTHLILHRCNSC